MLKLYHGNRVEHLATELVSVVGDASGDAFAPEVIIVQSQGMAHWLQIKIAERLSIAANIDSPLPASFVWRLFTSQLKDVPDRSPYDRDILAWRLLDALADCLGDEGFEPLCNYLANDDSEFKRYQLAYRIADLFDQYLIYRPRMVMDWDKGEGDDWQARLWRIVSCENPHLHRAALLERFDQLCDAGKLDRAALPQRLCVFGLTTMPPAFFHVLYRLAEVIDVHLFFFNPCLLYWGDIRDEKTRARIRRKRAQFRQAQAGDDYISVGNSLLASMGKQGQDFVNLLHNFDPLSEQELFVPVEEVNLLSRIQSDILLLENRGKNNSDIESSTKTPIKPDDNSIVLHACHSPMREMEILHDQLLGLFDSNADLTPRDVVVMAPDIDAYAPYIDAVFSAAERGEATKRTALPYTIADRSVASVFPVVDAFLGLLDLPASRYLASQVMAVLEVPSVAKRFAIDEEDLERIRNWVRRCGIRWGLDERTYRQHNLPASDLNTWRFGLDRLFMGYALGKEDALFSGIAPYQELGDAEPLGKLCRFIETLAEYGKRLGTRRRVKRWVDTLNTMLDAFFLVNDDEEESSLMIIREALADLEDKTSLAGFKSELDLDVVKHYLSEQLNQVGKGQRFFTGQITFCAMLPMRSIPFKVVCLLGMNDRDYPRQQRTPMFDKMATDPKPGDRSRREDDRYLFLEALLSARRHLYISYVGKNPRDNTDMLPSVLVTELMDYIEQGFEIQHDKPGSKVSASEKLIVQHPSQPFSRRYFEADSAYRSYAGDWLVGARALSAENRQIPPFIKTALAPPSNTESSREVDDVLLFFQNPAEYFLRQRWDIRLQNLAVQEDDTEPFELDYLNSYLVSADLIDKKLSGGDISQEFARLKASGVLPQSAVGELEYERVADASESFYEKLQPFVSKPADPVDIDLQLEGFNLVGRLENVNKEGLLRYRPGMLKGRDRLHCWIQHLYLNAAAPNGNELRSTFVARDRLFQLPPVDDPKTHLSVLLSAYRRGLIEPLAFFAETSFAYASAVGRDSDPNTAVYRAWEGDAYRGIAGDQDNLSVQTVFRGRDPLDDNFARLALEIFTPMLNICEEQKLD